MTSPASDDSPANGLGWDHDPTWKADDFIPIVYFELGGSSRRAR